MYPNNTFNLEKALSNVAAMKQVQVPDGFPKDFPTKLETAFKNCKSEG